MAKNSIQFQKGISLPLYRNFSPNTARKNSAEMSCSACTGICQSGGDSFAMDRGNGGG